MSNLYLSAKEKTGCGLEPLLELPGREQRRQVPSVAALGFPSPANEDLALAGPEDVLSNSSALHDSRHCGSDLYPDALPRPPVIRSITQDTATSPLLDGPSFQSVDALGIGRLPLPDLSLAPTTTVSKGNHSLRLPSFQALGIAAPHPDHISLRPDPIRTFSSIGVGPLSRPEDPLHESSPSIVRPGLGAERAENSSLHPDRVAKPSQRSISHFIPTFTPPDDNGTLNWSSLVNVRTQAMESPASDPEGSATRTDRHSSAASRAGASGSPVMMELEKRPWLQGVIDAMDIPPPAPGTRGSLKVLSHALPAPSLSGHAFPTIINAILYQTRAASTTWINVFHALPGQYQLSDLPSSPPSTPGPAVGGDDYFTTRVFDSAIRIEDYQGKSPPASTSPHPIVAPGSVDLSIVERYIPPTNAQEFSELFTASPQSVLHDRLVELSPDNGTLIFIYPTKTGATTFKKEYLGPIIEPYLRATCLIHNIPMDAAGSKVAEMAAIPRMLEFTEVRARLRAFCANLSDGSQAHTRYHGPNVKFTLAYAAKEEVQMSREVWAANWWTKQEKPRISGILNSFFGRGGELKKLPDEHDVMASNLVKEILDKVCTLPYQNGEPTKGVEIGVYVITKTSD